MPAPGRSGRQPPSAASTLADSRNLCLDRGIQSINSILALGPVQSAGGLETCFDALISRYAHRTLLFGSHDAMQLFCCFLHEQLTQGIVEQLSETDK